MANKYAMPVALSGYSSCGGGDDYWDDDDDSDDGGGCGFCNQGQCSPVPSPGDPLRFLPIAHSQFIPQKPCIADVAPAE